MKDGYPASASSFAVNLTGGAAFLLAVTWLDQVWSLDLVIISICGILAAILALLVGEIFFLKSYRRERVGLRSGVSYNWPVLAIKLIALNVTLVLVASIYQFIPEYEKTYYAEFHTFLPFLLVAAFVFSNLYVFLLDHRLGSPDDGLLHFGYIITGKWKEARSTKLADYFKSVALRAYFVPAMYIYMIAALEVYLGGSQDYLDQSTAHLTGIPGQWVISTLFLTYFFLNVIDGLFALIGYLITFKALDSDVRSTEPTLTGWVSCLLCYTPFFEILLANLLLREFYSNPQWFVWFASEGALLLFWGCLATFAMCAEAFTTMTFGIRFSNLTYRGLISNGLFRFTKHPQYISKLLNRFLVFVPFMSVTGFTGALWTMFLFGMICFLYFVRARTEENHLSIYDDYALYAEWMNERSIFVPFSRLLPFLRYSREKALSGKLF